MLRGYYPQQKLPRSWIERGRETGTCNCLHLGFCAWESILGLGSRSGLTFLFLRGKLQRNDRNRNRSYWDNSQSNLHASLLHYNHPLPAVGFGVLLSEGMTQITQPQVPTAIGGGCPTNAGADAFRTRISILSLAHYERACERIFPYFVRDFKPYFSAPTPIPPGTDVARRPPQSNSGTSARSP